MDLVKEQNRLENEQLVSSRLKVLNQFTSLLAKGGGADTPEGMALKRLGIKRLSSSIKEYLNAEIRGKGSTKRKPLLIYKGREEELALLTITSVLTCILERPTTLQAVTNSIRRNLINATLLDRFKKEQPKLNSYLEYEYKRRGQEYILSRKKRLAQMILTNSTEDLGQNTALALMDVVLQANLGLFDVIRRFKGGVYSKSKTKMYYLSLTDEAREVMSHIQDFLTGLCILYKPILLPPKRWSIDTFDTLTHGGYFFSNRIGLVKHKNKISRELFNNHIDFCNTNKDSEESKSFNTLCGIINGIQDTKWRVNSYILDIVDIIIANNIQDYQSPVDNPRCIGDIPFMEYVNVDDIVKPESFGEVYKVLDSRGIERIRHVKKEDYKAYYTIREKTLAKLEANNSNRVMFQLAVSLAKDFSKYEHFYFSYTMDFRGRLYPVQQLLNPQSHSRIKALLEFSEGVIATEEGIKWIKIGIANSSGRDKLTFKERIAWVDANLDNIKEAQEKPLEMISWWNDTDEPLLFLSGCKALSDALKGIPVHYPVPLDATCSGIQMYSGLLLDKEGAEAVNVVPTLSKEAEQLPSDIYQQVADKVEGYIEAGEYPKYFDFIDSEGVDRRESTVAEARGLKGQVTRSLTKRNVMTQPYSVTQRGMYNQLKEIFDKEEADGNIFWKGKKWVNLRLLVILNSRAIGETVKGATRGQSFLKDVAFYLNIENKPMKWLTPVFKFPVIQAQPKIAEKRVISSLGKIKFKHVTDDVDRRRQISAIAPNYIHSLDATLMYLTIQKLLAEGVTSFALIHDSFATDCNNVALLNKSVRDSYIELFKGKPLEDWYRQVEAQSACGIPITPASVMVGDLDLEEVRTSMYMFS
jgi:DNA-directed RNA polymerase